MVNKFDRNTYAAIGHVADHQSHGYWIPPSKCGARYLNEDPWERLRTIRKEVKNATADALRGQSLLGYKHSDDVVSAFVEKSIENGIDVVRVFDALNDLRN